MNDSDGFLSRWARRKRDVARGESAPEKAAPPKVVDTPAATSDGAAAEDAKRVPLREPAERTFDLSKLPSIESITGETDIRPFLAAGVPAALRQAALRRLWAIDPHVRGIVELAENTWDFTAPGVPGFDLSPPTGNIGRMIADIFGKSPAEPEGLPNAAGDTVAEQHAHRNVSEPARDETQNEIASPETFDETPAVRRTNLAEHKSDDVAAQGNTASDDHEIVAVRRTHGGAMPK